MQVSPPGVGPEAPVPAPKPHPHRCCCVRLHSKTAIGITSVGYGALPPDEPEFFLFSSAALR